MSPHEHAVLVELTRGPLVEACHRGSLAVVSADGRLLASAGDPQHVAYLRSSAKPFQALPGLRAGLVEKLGVTDREISLMCASHNGEPEHVEVALSILRRAGLGPEHLQCGHHPPYRPFIAEEVARGDWPWGTVNNNCSGKHAGMLAACVLRGWPVESYLEISHPLQQEILRTMALFAGIEPSSVAIGIDGCGVPAFGLPLQAAAHAYARLVDPAGLPEHYPALCGKVTSAMMTYPYMVAGRERICTDLMHAFPGKVVAKTGAEGYYGIGFPPGVVSKGPGERAGGRGIGLALKIADGEAGRARHAAVMEIFRQLGLYERSPGSSHPLEKYDDRVVVNRRATEVGVVRTPFRL